MIGTKASLEGWRGFSIILIAATREFDWEVYNQSLNVLGWITGDKEIM